MVSVSDAAEFRDHINSRKIFLLTELLVNAHKFFNRGSPEMQYMNVPLKLVSNRDDCFLRGLHLRVGLEFGTCLVFGAGV